MKNIFKTVFIIITIIKALFAKNQKFLDINIESNNNNIS